MQSSAVMLSWTDNSGEGAGNPYGWICVMYSINYSLSLSASGKSQWNLLVHLFCPFPCGFWFPALQRIEQNPGKILLYGEVLEGALQATGTFHTSGEQEFSTEAVSDTVEKPCDTAWTFLVLNCWINCSGKNPMASKRNV